MKIVVFADLHGSLNSLKALIKTEDFKQADKIIFLGDVAVGCSRLNECVDLLVENECVCLLGNNDGYVVDHIPEVDRPDFASNKLIMVDWMKENITEKNKEIIKSWPRDVSMHINNKKFYFTHYAWEEQNNDINVVKMPKTIDSNSRKEMFKDIDADYIILGHEHETNYFSDWDKHYFCIGSIGLQKPGVYLLINSDNEKIELKEKFVDFDINEEIDLMDIAGYPYSKQKIKRSDKN